jgi:hypothetical protein
MKSNPMIRLSPGLVVSKTSIRRTLRHSDGSYTVTLDEGGKVHVEWPYAANITHFRLNRRKSRISAEGLSTSVLPN